MFSAALRCRTTFLGLPVGGRRVRPSLLICLTRAASHGAASDVPSPSRALQAIMTSCEQGLSINLMDISAEYDPAQNSPVDSDLQGVPE